MPRSGGPQADRARAQLAELTDQIAEEEAEAPADLVARISSSEEARSFALMCLQAIEEYELQIEAIRQSRTQSLSSCQPVPENAASAG